MKSEIPLITEGGPEGEEGVGFCEVRVVPEGLLREAARVEVRGTLTAMGLRGRQKHSEWLGSFQQMQSESSSLIVRSEVIEGALERKFSVDAAGSLTIVETTVEGVCVFVDAWSAGVGCSCRLWCCKAIEESVVYVGAGVAPASSSCAHCRGCDELLSGVGASVGAGGGRTSAAGSGAASGELATWLVTPDGGSRQDGPCVLLCAFDCALLSTWPCGALLPTAMVESDGCVLLCGRRAGQPPMAKIALGVRASSAAECSC